MTKTRPLFAAAALLGALALPAFVHVATAAESAAADLAEAEVRKIDLDQGKVTLKHGPIKNLDMPGMTMVFGVKDKAMLDGVKPGDRVRFRAVDDNGRLTVVEMMPAR